MKTAIYPFKIPGELRNLTQDDLVIVIPPNLRSKAELLRSYDEQISSDFSFGMNWDALSDALNDFSWSNARSIFVVHSDQPLKDSPQDKRIYFEVLAEAVNRWQSDCGGYYLNAEGQRTQMRKKFNVVFPEPVDRNS